MSNPITVNHESETLDPRRTITPRVDIFENNEELVLLADLPGVSKGELNLRVFFERARSRRELVLAFLSVLELVRTTEVKLFQRETFGDIIARVAA